MGSNLPGCCQQMKATIIHALENAHDHSIDDRRDGIREAIDIIENIKDINWDAPNE